jgi:hypothetical protein
MFNVQNGMLCDDPISLAHAVSFQSVWGEQIVEMAQCVEECRTETKNDKKITKCSYKVSWMPDTVSTGSFKDQNLAQRSCRGYTSTTGNPVWPWNFAHGSQILGASGVVQAGDPGHPYTFSQDLLEGLKPPDMNVVPVVTLTGNLASDPTARPLRVTKENTVLLDGYIQTCRVESVGCVRIKYYKNSATQPTVLAHVASNGRLKPQDVPSSWLCPAASRQWIDKEKLTFEQFIRRLTDAEKAMKWIFRALGILAAWLSVFCIFSPITTAADLLGDCVSFIPCIGGMIEDLIEGLVTSLVCVLSCGIGCSCAFFVIAVVWLVMKPLYGSLLLIAACCCLCGAVGCVKALHGNSKGNSRQFRGQESSSE